MLSSLHVRNYRYYASGSLVSNIGLWAGRIAQDLLVYRLSGNSGTVVGIVTGLQFLPVLMFTLWGGALADRLPKRLLLVGTQTCLGLVMAVLAVLDLTGVAQVWHVYVLVFLFGTAAAFDGPARQSFVSEMVPAGVLPNAVSLNSTTFNAARLVGPALAGVAVAAVGTGWVILANAVSYGFVVASLLVMRTSELHAPPVQLRRGRVLDGLRYVRGRPELIVSMSAVFVIGTFGLNLQVTSLLMATQTFHLGAGAYGLLGSAAAVGSLGAAVSGLRRTGSRLRFVLIGAIGFAAALAVSSVMPAYWLFAVALVPVGFFGITSVLFANVFHQLSAGRAFRGRVMALHMLALQGGTPVGAPLVGWVGQTFGARQAVAFCALGLAVGVGVPLVVYLRLLARRGVHVHAHLLPRPSLAVDTVDTVDTVAVGPVALAGPVAADPVAPETVAVHPVPVHR